MAENKKSPESIDPDLSQIILFLSGFVKKLIERLADGFQPLPDTLALLPSLMAGQEAYEGNENAWKYLASLDDTKTNETVDFIMGELNEVDEKKREIIKRGLLFAANGYMLFLAIKVGTATAGGAPTPPPANP